MRSIMQRRSGLFIRVKLKGATLDSDGEGGGCAEEHCTAV